MRIGAMADWEAEREGSIVLEAIELRQRGDAELDVWLLTLNCCESATQAHDARNLAGSLVVAGFPSVVGMRERVASSSASVFSERFFDAVLRMIGTVQPGGPPVEIEWASVLWEARQSLVTQNHAGDPYMLVAPDMKEWTIPVLYTRREPFRIRRLPDPTGLSVPELQQLMAQWDQLKAERLKIAARTDMPVAMKNAILAEFDARIAQLEQSLGH